MCIRDRYEKRDHRGNAIGGIAAPPTALAVHVVRRRRSGIRGSGGCDYQSQGPWQCLPDWPGYVCAPVSYTHLRAHETVLDLVCRLLLEKKKKKKQNKE